MNFFSTLTKKSKNELSFIENLKTLKTDGEKLVSNL